MTIKQYQKLAAKIAKRIEDLGGDPRRVKNLRADTPFVLHAHDPKLYENDGYDGAFENKYGTIISKFDTISNPNNPNYKFKTLKPGSISLYYSSLNENIDLSDYRMNSQEFAILMEILDSDEWRKIR